jgi:hypothetical protein
MTIEFSCGTLMIVFGMSKVSMTSSTNRSRFSRGSVNSFPKHRPTWWCTYTTFKPPFKTSPRTLTISEICKSLYLQKFGSFKFSSLIMNMKQCGKFQGRKYRLLPLRNCIVWTFCGGNDRFSSWRVIISIEKKVDRLRDGIVRANVQHFV